MQSHLSALKFVRNNKKQVRVIMIALSLTFITMYLIHFIFLSGVESISMMKPTKLGYFLLSDNTLGVKNQGDLSVQEYNEQVAMARNHIMEELEQQEGIKYVFYNQCIFVNYKIIVGSGSFIFPLMEAENIPKYLGLMDATLIEGRMPEHPGELLIDQRVMNNLKLKIGDYYEANTFGEIFTVAGVVTGDYPVCVGIPNGYTNAGWRIFVLCDEEHNNMTQLLKQVGIAITQDDDVADVETFEEMMGEFAGVLNSTLVAILLIVMVFLTISITVAYISFMRSRVNEYCLYSSIGFSRREIYEMMLKEIGIIFGSSIILGAILTIPSMVLMGKLVLDQLGLIYRYFYPEQLLRILAAFFMIVAILQIPMVITIQNIKTIDKVEE